MSLLTEENNIFSTGDGTPRANGFEKFQIRGILPPLHKSFPRLRRFNIYRRKISNSLCLEKCYHEDPARESPRIIRHEVSSDYIWLHHICRQIYHHGINCTQCTKTQNGKRKLITLGLFFQAICWKTTRAFCTKGRDNLGFQRSLVPLWGKKLYIFSCIDFFSKLPSAKITSNTSNHSVIDTTQDEIYFLVIGKLFRVERGSCRKNQYFELFYNPKK